jgi:rfaE bifunctional protein nucleotidyltransferase chain/domain
MIIRNQLELLKIVNVLHDNYIDHDHDGNDIDIILTNGCFDLLHYGHIKYLNNMKTLARQATGIKDSILIVALNTDQSVLQYKGRLPIIEEIERAIVLDELNCVDIVYLMQDVSPANLLRVLRPSVYIKGHDWPFERLPEKDLLNELHIIYCCDSSTKNTITSTKIKNRITDNEF